MFEEYLNVTGISKAFQLIFGEVIKNKVEANNVFAYAAMRLRQLGKELAPLMPENLTANLNTEEKVSA